MYCDITTPETPDTSSSAKDVLEATSLSLFHDTRRFWVIYQNKDGQLVAHNEKDQKRKLGTAVDAIGNLPHANSYPLGV